MNRLGVASVALVLVAAGGGCPGESGGGDVTGPDASVADVLDGSDDGVSDVLDGSGGSDTTLQPDVVADTSEPPGAMPSLPGRQGVACGAAPLPFAGALCGGAGAPCALLARETVSTGSSAAGRVPRSPSIALDAGGRPGIFTVAMALPDPGSASPFLLFERTAPAEWAQSTITSLAWSAESWSATGGIVYYADGPAVLVSDAMLNVSIHARTAQGWELRDTLPLRTPFSGRNVLHDQAGCLRALSDPAGSAAVATTPLVSYLRWDGATADASVLGAEPQSSRVALALAPSGAPHALWLEGLRPQNVLWSADGAAAEVAFADANEVPGELLEATLGVDALGAPHGLVRHLGLANGAVETTLWHVTRGQSGWTSTGLDGVAEMPQCVPATRGGVTCSVEGDGATPLAVVTSGDGSVRLLWTRFHEAVTQAYTCASSSFCTWQIATRERVGSLLIAAPGGPATVVATDIALEQAGAVVDDAGRIHLVGLDGGGSWSAANGGFIAPLVYLQIGPVGLGR